MKDIKEQNLYLCLIWMVISFHADGYEDVRVPEAEPRQILQSWSGISVSSVIILSSPKPQPFMLEKQQTQMTRFRKLWKKGGVLLLS